MQAKAQPATVARIVLLADATWLVTLVAQRALAQHLLSPILDAVVALLEVAALVALLVLQTGMEHSRFILMRLAVVVALTEPTTQRTAQQLIPVVTQLLVVLTV